MSLYKSDWLTAFSTTIKVEPISTYSVKGVPSFGTASTYDAFVEQVHKLVVTGAGKEEVATEVVHVLSSSAKISLQDKITLPSGRTPKILNIYTLTDDEGAHHLEVFLG